MASTSTGGGGSRKPGDDKDKGKRAKKREWREGREHKAYTVVDKQNMLDMIDEGARNCDIVRTLGVPESTVRSIKRNKKEVKKNLECAKKYFGTGGEGAQRAVREVSQMNHLLVITEHYLLKWLKDKASVDGVQIRETAREYYAGICKKKKIANPPSFTASKGWLQRFKKRYWKHASYQGELTSADEKAAKDYVKELIVQGNYSPEQVFNCDATDVYWRRTPESTSVPKELKQSPGGKLAKDRFSVLFTCNASGDCKIKPFIFNKFTKPHSFGNCDMQKLSNCYWCSNKKGYMTTALSLAWFDDRFVPDAKAYCESKGKPFKVILFMDNAPGHAQLLVGRHASVKVVFLPPNTTAKIQPLDQELIANVKLIFYRYLHQRLRDETDSQDELRDIKEEASDEDDKADDAAPQPTASTPSSPTRSTSRAGLALSLPPSTIASIKQFWKGFQIKQAVDLVCRAWREITTKTIRHAWDLLLPHFKLQEQERQRQEDLLQATTAAIQQVPGMSSVKVESVRAMIQPVVEDDEGEEEMPAEKSSELTTSQLSGLLGDCEGIKETVTNTFGEIEKYETALQYLEEIPVAPDVTVAVPPMAPESPSAAVPLVTESRVVAGPEIAGAEADFTGFRDFKKIDAEATRVAAEGVVAKGKRNSGEANVSKANQSAEARRVASPCGCRDKCFTRVGLEAIHDIFTQYWGLGEGEAQTAYIAGRVRQTAVKRSGKDSRRSTNHLYNVIAGGEEIGVCRTAFYNIHGIAERRVRYPEVPLSQVSETAVSERDRRGRRELATRSSENQNMTTRSSQIQNMTTRSSQIQNMTPPRVEKSSTLLKDLGVDALKVEVTEEPLCAEACVEAVYDTCRDVDQIMEPAVDQIMEPAVDPLMIEVKHKPSVDALMGDAKPLLRHTHNTRHTQQTRPTRPTRPTRQTRHTRHTLARDYHSKMSLKVGKRKRVILDVKQKKMSLKVAKGKRVILDVKQKLELLRKLEKGSSVKMVCQEYGIKKQTVSDIRKSKEKLEKYVSSYCVDASASKRVTGTPRKYMLTGKSNALSLAVMKWYVQQRARGGTARGEEIRAVASKLANQLGMEDFKASEGWLWRFRNRHGLCSGHVRGKASEADNMASVKPCSGHVRGKASEAGNMASVKPCSGHVRGKASEAGNMASVKPCSGHVRGEASEADNMASVKPFRRQLQRLMDDEGLTLSFIYNADETGLYWRSMPKNTQLPRGEETTRGNKSSKERLSVLVCCNASGTHRVCPAAAAAKAKHPHVIKDLPLTYYHSKKAWFTSDIFEDWFFHHFVPAVRTFQEEVLKIPAEEVKAVLLLDVGPAHPSADQLVSADGNIRVMYLPPNTSVQPMDQGMISALKRRYFKRYLDEVLVVPEEARDAIEDARGEGTKGNIKAYNIRSALYNIAYSWTDMKISTLTNSWKMLLLGEETEGSFEGFEVDDFHRLLRRAGERETTVDSVRDWLDENDTAAGCQLLTDEEIMSSAVEREAEESSEGEEEVARPRVTLPTLRTYIDALIHYTTYSSLEETAAHHGHLRRLRELVIREQRRGGRQTNSSSFFAPRRPATRGQSADDPDDLPPGQSSVSASLAKLVTVSDSE